MSYRWMTLALVATLGLALAGSATAQSRFPMFGISGGKAMLLMSPDVQQELKLSEEQLTKVREVSQQVIEKNKDNFGKLKDLPKDQQREKFQEMAKTIAAETDNALKDVLKADQHKRLRQLELQQRGAQAFADADVQKELKLTDDQKDKIKTLSEDAGKEMREIFQNAQGNFQDAMTKVNTLRKETLEKVTATLGADQKKAWQEMTGAPFEFKLRRPEPKKDG